MRGSGRVPSVSGDKRLPAAALSSGGETNEKCPRCGSHNTKFCYFNNYNLAQPRHFCKACRRYWTVGGTLRNVPIGGSTRRTPQQPSKQPASVSSAVRRRAAPASASASPSSSSSSSPTMTSLVFEDYSFASLSAACKADVPTANESSSMDAVRSFESLLSESLPAGFLAVGDPFLGGCEGFGLGMGLGGGPAEIIDDIGLGIGRAAPAWPYFVDDEVSILAGVSSTADGRVGGIEPGRDSWQVVAGGSELVGRDGGDCVGWPELAITMTPGKGME